MVLRLPSGHIASLNTINGFGGAAATQIVGRYLYLIDYGSNSMQIYDVSVPSAPQQISSFGIGAPQDLYVQGHYAYITTTGALLSVVDVSNPHSPTLVSSMGSGGGSVYVQGRYAYMI